MIEIIREHGLNEKLSILYNDDGSINIVKLMPYLNNAACFAQIYIHLEVDEIELLKKELLPSPTPETKRRKRGKLVTLVK